MSVESPLSNQRKAINGYVTAYNNLVRTLGAPAPELEPMAKSTPESAQSFREDLKHCWDEAVEAPLEDFAEAIIDDEVHEIGTGKDSFEELGDGEQWDALDAAKIDKERLCNTLHKIDGLTARMLERTTD